MISIVRKNLLTRQHYSPYCGNPNCRTIPRTTFDGQQFNCSRCGWRSEFPQDFIDKYKAKWNMK